MSLRNLVLLFVVGLCDQVLADVVVMNNGDRITGEISRIWGDDLSIEPEYADEFDVDLTEVAYIESDRDFEITLDDGREVTAQLRGAFDDGRQIVVHESDTYYVAVTDLVQVEEPEDYSDWESHIDWNSNFSNGNTDSKASRLTADATIKIGDHRHLADVMSANEESFGVVTKDQELFSYQYNWLFADRWFFGANASYESDPIRDLAHRRIVGAGIGFDIWDFFDRSMNFDFGLGTVDESIGGDAENDSLAYWNFRLNYELQGTDLEFYHNHRILRYLGALNNNVRKSSTGVRYELNDLFYLTMSLNVDYESDPALGREKKDSTWVLGLGFEF